MIFVIKFAVILGLFSKIHFPISRISRPEKKSGFLVFPVSRDCWFPGKLAPLIGSYLGKKKYWTFILFLFFKVLVIPNILTKNEKNSTRTSPSKWRSKLTIFQHFGALDRSEMAQVQNSSYEIEPTVGAQEYEHQRIGQLNFHCVEMLLYCELYHVKNSSHL